MARNPREPVPPLKLSMKVKKLEKQELDRKPSTMVPTWTRLSPREEEYEEDEEEVDDSRSLYRSSIHFWKTTVRGALASEVSCWSICSGLTALRGGCTALARDRNAAGGRTPMQSTNSRQ